jgi:hypothetical protein
MQPTADPEKLPKLEALRRQLRQTIHLFFSEGDDVAVHTLAAASAQALEDIAKHRGFQGALPDLRRVKPEHRSMVRARLRSAQNFFKHGDKDAEGVLDFYPGATPFTILNAVQLYEMVSEISMPSCKAYHAWFSMNYPQVLTDGLYKEFITTSVSTDPDLTSKAVALALLRSMEAE